MDPRQPPHLTQPLGVRMLHFPPSGRAGAEAGWCPAMHRFKFTAKQLSMGSTSFDFSIQNIDQHMYMYPPAPTPDQSLESAEAPLSSLGKGRRQGRLVHRSYAGSIQFSSGEHYLRVFFFMQIENYTEHWLLHVRVPTCPHAQPIPWECGCSTFLPWERPAPRQASTQPCSSSKY